MRRSAWCQECPGTFLQNLHRCLSAPRGCSASFVIQITGWEAPYFVGVLASSVSCLEPELSPAPHGASPDFGETLGTAALVCSG